MEENNGLVIGERVDTGALHILRLDGRSFGSGQIEIVQLYVLQKILASLDRIEKRLTDSAGAEQK